MLTDVKEKVGKLMVEDIPRMKQLEQRVEEFKSKDQLLKAQWEELVALGKIFWNMTRKQSTGGAHPIQD